MKRAAIGAVSALLTLTTGLSCSSVPEPSPPTGADSAGQDGPPPARVEVVVDEPFGVRLEDPYRWMEAPENKEFDAWMRAQGKHTRAQLTPIAGREALLKRIRELSLGSSSVYRLQRAGDRVFYMKVDKGDSLAKLVVVDGGGERVLVDPSKLASSDAGHPSIDNYAASPDGRHVAYNLAAGGGEITTVHVIDATTGELLPDRVERIWGEFPASWRPDGTGFFYTQMAAQAFSDPQADKLAGMRVRFHKLGTSVDTDADILGPDVNPTMTFAPREFPFVWIPRGSAWAIALGVGARRENRLYAARVADVRDATATWQRIAEYDDGVEGFAIHGDHLYALTTKDAPNRRIVKLDLTRPDVANAEVVIPNGDTVLMNVVAARDGLYVLEMRSGTARITRLPYGGSAREDIALPFAGWASLADAAVDRDGVVISLEGWTEERAFYEYKPGTKQLVPTGLKNTSPANYNGIMSELVEVESFDGARVPLTIIHRRDLIMNGENAAIIDGYGGYGFSRTPSFSATRLAWLERGGVYAYAHVRGGGEKGDAWYTAGKGPNKPNGIKDFIACAEFLANNGYTTASRLAARGGSMGGVLIGRAITERPDAFAAAVIHFGMLNVIRFLHGSNGANQLAELGSPETEDGLRALLAMDAYHNIKPGGRYPAVLLPVGLNDARVSPWMTGKFGARLQAATQGSSAVLIRVESDAGHGVGSTRDQFAELLADEWSFVLWQIGHPEFVPKPRY